MICDLLVGFFANLMFALFLYTLYYIYFQRSKINFEKLFGPTNEKSYLVAVPQIDGDIAGIPVAEFAAINLYQSLVYRPKSNLWQFLTRAVGANGEIAPAFRFQLSSDVKGAASDQFISVGGPNLNPLAKEFFEHNPFAVEFKNNENGHAELFAHGNKLTNRVNEKNDFALIVKLNDDGRVKIYALGGGQNGSYSANRYLLENWKSLANEYNDRQFCIAFKVEQIENGDISVKLATSYRTPMASNIVRVYRIERE
ncbi:hypothetical protein K8I61_02430 [bacterium]|nr:hypothetical protein [bacterium]